MYNYANGFSNYWHIAHLGARAAGGAGLVIVEATAVEASGRISPQDLGIWTDAHTAPLRHVAEAIKLHGATAGIQIGHAGRKANTTRPWRTKDDNADAVNPDWDVVGPSAIAYSPKHILEPLNPRPLGSYI